MEHGRANNEDVKFDKYRFHSMICFELIDPEVDWRYEYRFVLLTLNDSLLDARHTLKEHHNANLATAGKYRE